MTINDIYKLDENKLRKLSLLIGINYHFLKGGDVSSKASSLYMFIKKNNKEIQVQNFLNIIFNNRKKIGVSYAFKDRTYVNKVCDGLEKNNYEIFIDEKNIHEAEYVIKDFEEKLACQEILLFFLSKNYLQSYHCMYELYHNYFIRKYDIYEIVKHSIFILVDDTILNQKKIDTLESLWEKRHKQENRKFYNKQYVEREELGNRLNIYDRIHRHFQDIVLKLQGIKMIVLDKGNIENTVTEIIKRINSECNNL